MTAAEIRSATSLPSRVAWMACHFSPYATGLSNLPEALPPGAVLMLNDITPIRGHDPQMIRRQLYDIAEENRCSVLVLDFQRHPSAETRDLVECLVADSVYPVVVSAAFGEKFSCPVLLPPCPAHIPLETHIAPWGERDIWLEVSRSQETIAVTASGATVSSQSFSTLEEGGFLEEALHCHYRIETASELVRFSLWRTDADIHALCAQGHALGVRGFLGLYQELGDLSGKNENRSA